MFNQINVKVFGSLGSSNNHSLSASEVRDVSNPEEKSHTQIRSLGLELGTDLGTLYLLRLTLNKESTAELHKVKNYKYRF